MTDVLDDWRAELDLLGIRGDNGADEGEEAIAAETAETAEEDTGSESLAKFLLPDPENLVEQVGSIFRNTFGAIGDSAIIIFVAVFTAANPSAYRNGRLSLVARQRRQHFGRLLDDIGWMLRWWLVGQLCAMTAVGAATWLLLTAIGIPSALMFGRQAGILTFIPFLGPFIGGVAIVLVAMAQGGTMIFWTLGGYVVIQSGEGLFPHPAGPAADGRSPAAPGYHGDDPFRHPFRTARHPLATPLVAVIRLLVLRLYVDDTLGGAHDPGAVGADRD